MVSFLFPDPKLLLFCLVPSQPPALREGWVVTSCRNTDTNKRIFFFFQEQLIHLLKISPVRSTNDTRASDNTNKQLLIPRALCREGGLRYYRPQGTASSPPALTQPLQGLPDLHIVSAPLINQLYSPLPWGPQQKSCFVMLVATVLRICCFFFF